MSELYKPTKVRIATIVCEMLEIDRDELSDADLFREDHGASSLLVIEILLMLEQTFKIKIEPTDLGRMVNLTGTYDVMAESLYRAEAA